MFKYVLGSLTIIALTVDYFMGQTIQCSMAINPLVGAAALQAGGSFFGSLFGGSRQKGADLAAERRLQLQLNNQLNLQRGQFGENLLGRQFTAGQNLLGRQFTGEQNRLGREQQQGFFDVRREQVGGINQSLLGQVGLLRNLIGKPTISAEKQRGLVQQELAGLRGSNLRNAGTIARVLGTNTPAGLQTLNAGLLGQEARVTSRISQQALEQDFQRDQQFQQLIASLIGGQRTV